MYIFIIHVYINKRQIRQNMTCNSNFNTIVRTIEQLKYHMKCLTCLTFIFPSVNKQPLAGSLYQ